MFVFDHKKWVENFPFFKIFFYMYLDLCLIHHEKKTNAHMEHDCCCDYQPSDFNVCRVTIATSHS